MYFTNDTLTGHKNVKKCFDVWSNIDWRQDYEQHQEELKNFNEYQGHGFESQEWEEELAANEFFHQLVNDYIRTH